MKAGIITITNGYNYGNRLQNYAVQSALESVGISAETIWKTTNVFDTENPAYLRKLYIKRFLHYQLTKEENRILNFHRFNKNYIHRSKWMIDGKVPKNLHEKYEYFIAGSDQVWNSRYNNGVDRAFFLDFTESPKISYAASMGIDNFPPDEVTEVVSLLKRYRSISVRENQTVRYMLDLGLSFVTQDLDPTLLLTAEDWKKIIRYRSKSQPQYLLVYSVEGNNNDFIFQQASIIAREKGLKLYAVTAADPFKLKKYNCDKIYAFAGVEHFVTLLADAAFVVASSFHGTAFSINFNKEFVTVAPRRYNIRLKSLAQQLEVSHRIITSHEVSICDLQPLDYEFINEKLNICRMVSEDRLRSFLF